MAPSQVAWQGGPPCPAAKPQEGLARRRKDTKRLRGALPKRATSSCLCVFVRKGGCAAGALFARVWTPAISTRGLRPRSAAPDPCPLRKGLRVLPARLGLGVADDLELDPVPVEEVEPPAGVVVVVA